MDLTIESALLEEYNSRDVGAIYEHSNLVRVGWGFTGRYNLEKTLASYRHYERMIGVESMIIIHFSGREE